MPLRSMLPIVMALALAACSGSGGAGQATDAAAGANASSAATGKSSASATSNSTDKGVSFAKSEAKDGGQWDFKYAWPAAVTDRPALAALLMQEREAIMRKNRKSWIDALSATPADCASCRTSNFSKTWKVVAEVPGYLSLSADIAMYTGGAHGMYGRESDVWLDKQGKVVAGVEMFTSPAVLDKALQPALCRALDAARKTRRGADYKPAPTGQDYGFDSCQHVKDATVFVGSSDGRKFDKVGIWFGPYVAGPYAEGAYEITLPVTPAVLATVRPEYKAAFAAK
ncbi:DUF3298 and DUF4163 domain-containing protein [Tsuneonella mangrovi]|uniref:DUF3298 and DUF4163 domain-containing protein n=1 Tax=Tsuneonella mangrovi TaxID=1982042 RepID=UPI001237281A|nr:DUF4163 domain-containing protein [Tsuneonella mangrovi]